jgi:hypothetical protein
VPTPRSSSRRPRISRFHPATKAFPFQRSTGSRMIAVEAAESRSRLCPTGRVRKRAKDQRAITGMQSTDRSRQFRFDSMGRYRMP